MNARQRRIGRGFDRLAAVYDPVVKLVFGHRLDHLQSAMIERLGLRERVLMIGGGSGVLLPLVLRATEAREVFFAELSGKMRQRARERLTQEEQMRVRFIDHVDQIPSSEGFDAILLPFVLDCYRSPAIHKLLKECRQRLHPSGCLLITDFSAEPASGYQPHFLKGSFIALLYLFFRATAGIEAYKLEPFDALATEAGFELVCKQQRCQGWIQSTQWKLPSTAHNRA